MSAVPCASDELAVAVTAPAAIAVTSPASSTTATAVSLVAHSNTAPATACPFASAALAMRRKVSPATIVSAAWETSTVLACWATVTVAVPEADPAVAVMVAVPSLAAVTSPDASTPATAGVPLDQITDVPPITRPFWSRTSAASCVVAPRAVSSAAAGVTPTTVGRGGSGGCGAVPPSSPPQANVEAMATSAMVVTREIRVWVDALRPFGRIGPRPGYMERKSAAVLTSGSRAPRICYRF